MKAVIAGLVLSGPVYLVPVAGLVLAGWVGVFVGVVLEVALVGAVVRRPVEHEAGPAGGAVGALPPAMSLEERRRALLQLLRDQQRTSA